MGILHVLKLSLMAPSKRAVFQLNRVKTKQFFSYIFFLLLLVLLPNGIQLVADSVDSGGFISDHFNFIPVPCHTFRDSRHIASRFAWPVLQMGDREETDLFFTVENDRLCFNISNHHLHNFGPVRYYIIIDKPVADCIVCHHIFQDDIGLPESQEEKAGK